MNRFQLRTSLFLIIAAIFIVAGILAPSTTVFARDSCIGENGDCGGAIPENCCEGLTCYSPTNDPSASDWTCIPKAEATSTASTKPLFNGWDYMRCQGFGPPGVAKNEDGMIYSQGEMLDCKTVVGEYKDTRYNILKDGFSIEKIFNSMLMLISIVVAWISMYAIGFIVLFADPTTFKFATAPFVHTGWYVSLQLANLLLVLGLMYLANKFILGKEKFGDYSKLIKYITYAIFINFSLSIASFFIGISNYLTLAFLNLSAAPTDANTTAVIAVNFPDRIATIFESLAKMNEVSGTIATITNGFVIVIFSIVLLLVLGAIAFGFVRRVLYFWVLMMIMPLAYVLDVVGVDFGGKIGAGAGKIWQKKFMDQLTFGPIMAFVLWFTLLVMARISDAYNTIDPASVGHDLFDVIQSIIQPITFIFLLIFGYTQANAAGAGAGKAFDKAMGWAQNLPQKAGEKIGKWTGEQAKFRGAQIASNITGQEGVRKFIKNNRGMGGVKGFMANQLGALSDKNIEVVKGRTEPLVKKYENYKYEALKRLSGYGTPDWQKFITNNPEKAAAVSSIMASKHAGRLANEDGMDAKELKKMKALADSRGIEFNYDEVAKYNPIELIPTPKPTATPEEIQKAQEKRSQAIEKLTKYDFAKMKDGALTNPEFLKEISASQMVSIIVGRKGLGHLELQKFTDKIIPHMEDSTITELNADQVVDLCSTHALSGDGIFKILDTMKKKKGTEFLNKLRKPVGMEPVLRLYRMKKGEDF